MREKMLKIAESLEKKAGTHRRMAQHHSKVGNRDLEIVITAIGLTLSAVAEIIKEELEG